MDFEYWSQQARDLIQPRSDLVSRHLDYMKEFVRIDSRSFNVNEFEGDRTEPSDMQEILELARKYLLEIGFQTVTINTPPPGPERATPILMGALEVDPSLPTLLLYAHLDKQPYMDDHRFLKWDGKIPTELHWNAEGTRAYGRGAADDLSGVVGIGMAVDALIQAGPGAEGTLPCNIKVIFETEEESGSHSLIEQILQNRDFFSAIDAVIITDVTNPDTGVPGLTTSLRGIIQMNVEIQKDGHSSMDEQTALYKLLATLIDDQHALTLQDIVRADVPVTEEEERGYAKIPTTVTAIRTQAGILPEVRSTVPEEKTRLIQAQLRTSFVNARPGHRVAGSVVLGTAGVRMTLPLPPDTDRQTLRALLEKDIENRNYFGLRVNLTPCEVGPENHLVLDLVLQSSEKDPHSGINGGPFPIPELQLARWMDGIVSNDGVLSIKDLETALPKGSSVQGVTLQSLWTDSESPPRPFDEPSAKAVVEIRLAPGNDENEALGHLRDHLKTHVPEGFSVSLEEDKAGGPWMTSIEHPAFGLMMDSLKTGYEHNACLYGCGGSIPFVAKLMTALGEIPPLVIGAYDPDCKMHEPGESLSMVDLLGCARSVIHFLAHSRKAFK